MRVLYCAMDLGHLHAFATKRGPFRHAATVRGPRVTVAKRREAVRLLKAWALSTTKPRDRLKIIRRRWKR